MTAPLYAVMLVTALGAAGAMEAWAALLHGRVWHRALWGVHRSHHRLRKGTFEANDALSALHAPVAVALFVCGCKAPASVAQSVMLGIGVGMTLFGVSYFVCHDGLVHRRLPVQFLGRWPYFAALVREHRVHHALGGPPFGFFSSPFVRPFVRRFSGHGRPRARGATPSETASPPAASGAPRGTPTGAARPSRAESA